MEFESITKTTQADKVKALLDAKPVVVKIRTAPTRDRFGKVTQMPVVNETAASRLYKVMGVDGEEDVIRTIKILPDKEVEVADFEAKLLVEELGFCEVVSGKIPKTKKAPKRSKPSKATKEKVQSEPMTEKELEALEADQAPE